jgi:arginase
MTQRVNVIGAAIGVGAGNPGTSEGPLFIKENDSFLNELNVEFNWLDIIKTNTEERRLAAMPAIADFSEKLAKHTYQSVLSQTPFLTIGGDHSCGIGTWSGAAHAIREQGDLGLIWIDAHLDAHTPETSDSGNIHGMPVSTLLGHGDASLTEIMDKFPKIKPENLCYIGIRSYEPAEKALMEKLGIRVFYIEETHELGINKAIEAALEIATSNTAAFGISIDLDGIDPLHAPGVGTPVANGIDANELIDALKIVKQHPKLIGYEIAEFNPLIDASEKTLDVTNALIKALTEK